MVPANAKWYARVAVQRIVISELQRIDPRWQNLRVGDTMYFAAGGATNPAMVGTVSGIEPGRALWLGGWSFVLRPLDESTTRLIVRYPMEPGILGSPAFSFAVFEPAHFAMESGMMLGIKRRAERDPQLSALKGAYR